jgi:DNA/RNA-binding domain of Phe-tRNA-synthetase-like protein
MLTISSTDDWRKIYPGASFGFLELSHVENVPVSSSMDEQKRETEIRLRERYQGFTRQDFLALPVMSAYDLYYRHFDKTYHVLQQVESIVLKGKNLPNIVPLVDANFMAEVDTLVLTAGHDVAKLQGEITMDVARAGEQMVQMNGTPKTLLVGDMLMRDSHGVCCSIIYGQDNISPLSPQSTQALYVAYAPAGVPAEQVNTHLQRIWENVLLFAPAAVMEQKRLILA